MRCLIITLAITLSALFTNHTVFANSGEYAVLIKDIGNPYWKTFHNGLVETADRLGKNVFIQTLTSETDAETQLNQCETALIRKPAAIIFTSVNDYNLIPCLKKASEQGVALVNLDSSIDPDVIEENDLDIAFSVASDNYQLGKKAAEYLKEGEGQALVIEGHAGNQASVLRVSGFKENLPDEITVVASLPGDWDRLKAADITRDIITRYPGLDYIFAANDLMALGASETLRSLGYDRAQVIGIDGIADAIKAIREARLTASIAQLPYLIAKEGLEKTSQYIDQEKSFSYQQVVPIITLDRETLDSNSDPLLQYVR